MALFSNFRQASDLVSKFGTDDGHDRAVVATVGIRDGARPPVVEDAMWIFVVHDLNPRALAPHVTGFVQAQSWLRDLTPVMVA